MVMIKLIKPGQKRRSMSTMETKTNKRPRLGLDMGVFAVKGILLDGERMKKITVPTAGRPLQAAAECLVELLAELESLSLTWGWWGTTPGCWPGSLG